MINMITEKIEPTVVPSNNGLNPLKAPIRPKSAQSLNTLPKLTVLNPIS